MSTSGPDSPTGHLWALQCVEKEDIISLRTRDHKERFIRYYCARQVGDMSIPQGQGNGGHLLHCVSNKRNLKSSFQKQKLPRRLCLHQEQWELFDTHVKETQMKQKGLKKPS